MPKSYGTNTFEQSSTNAIKLPAVAEADAARVNDDAKDENPSLDKNLYVLSRDETEEFKEPTILSRTFTTVLSLTGARQVSNHGTSITQLASPSRLVDWFRLNKRACYFPVSL